MPATGPVRQSNPGKPSDLGDCRHPQTFLDRTTGDVVYGRCKATTADLCPPCAEQHRGDGKTIIQAGIAQTHQRQDSISFVTLTPPSFWRADIPDDTRHTHRLHKPYWKLIRGSSKPSPKVLNSERRRAICGPCTTQRRAEAKASGVPVRSVPPVIHSPEDPLAGLPIDLDAFDYEAAAWWNWNLGDLLHRTFTYARRHFDTDLEYLRVLETSRRGVPHVHALITGELSRSDVRALIEAVNASLPAGRQGWGPVFDVQVIPPTDQLAAARAGGYLAKYLTKQSTHGLVRSARTNPHARLHFENFQRAAEDIARRHALRHPGGRCPDCDGFIHEWDISRLGCLPITPGQRVCRTSHFNRIPLYTRNLGIRARTLTKSRSWAIEHRPSKIQKGIWLPLVKKDGTPKPLTFTAIRRRRRCWARRHTNRPQQGPWLRLPQVYPQTPSSTTPRGPHQPNAPPPLTTKP